MELVKRFKNKENLPKYKETRLSIASFICALLTLAYFNIVLITRNDFSAGTGLFFPTLPVIGVILALLSFTRVNYKKIFAWWALALFLFMFVCIVVIAFYSFIIYPKP